MFESVVHLAIYERMADWEAAYAVSHIVKHDFQQYPGRYRVKTVAERSEPIVTMGGMKVIPDMILDELDPDDSVMLILPGSDIALEGGTESFGSMARLFLEQGIAVAAICGATAGLAAEGLLDGRRHTSNAAEFLDSVGYGGAELYVDEPAITDGDLITASGLFPVEFAVEICRRLDLYNPAVLDAWCKIYGSKNPSGYYELLEAAS